MLPLSLSDHADLVYVVLGLKRIHPKPVYITTCSFEHDDRDGFRRDISLAHWSVTDSFEDVEGKLNVFNLLFNPILDNHAPVEHV